MVKLKQLRDPLTCDTTTELLTKLRAVGVSVPRCMVLAAVRDGTVKYPSVYIGEVHALYLSHASKVSNHKPYTYSGVAAMLNTLHKQGLVSKSRDGRWVQFTITSQGQGLLMRVGI